MWQKIKPYAVSIAIALAVGGLSAWLTSGNMELYASLRQPPLAPPGIVFPIVWTILFILMGFGAADVYVRREQQKIAADNALAVYAVNLVVNFLWSILFFHYRAFGFSFFWLIFLTAIVVKMIFSFYRVSPRAAYLQIPYLIWLSFAGYLNCAIWLLNR